MLANVRRGVEGLEQVNACLVVVWKPREIIWVALGACLIVLAMAKGRRMKNAILEVCRVKDKVDGEVKLMSREL